jgi:DNA mismatch repair protein MutL
LKFLKAATTESAQIAELIGAYAMAYPHLRFSLVTDGRLAFQTAGSGKLRDVLVKVFGFEVAKQMLEVDAGNNEIKTRVSGFISPPAVHRSTRKYLFLFVNGRWIEDRSLAHAITEAYHTALMVGRFPIAVLNIALPTEEVDVNVHPAKSQVRFRSPGTVYQAVQRTVRQVVMQHAPATHTYVPPLPPPGPPSGQPPIDPGFTMPFEGLDARIQSPSAQPASPAPNPVIPPSTSSRFPMLRVLGQIASTYLLSEGPDGMYVIDQHAAHERVLYEKMVEERTHAAVPSQALLEPALLELAPLQFATFQREFELLNGCGFALEEFGASTVLIRALPMIFKTNDPRQALIQVLDEMNEGNLPIEQATEARLITAICKGAAIKGGQTLSLEEMRELVRQLEQTQSPRTCPHGRPTVIRFDLNLLEREFGRRG